jgi:sec-independent protein translocase protein TatB
MFDIGSSELLMIIIVAVVVIGPKDMPRAMRTAGRWIGKARRMSNHFRAGIDEMIRQAEIEDMEAKWAERNKQIMAKYPNGDEPAGGAPEDLLPAAQMEPLDPADADARAEAAIARAAPDKAPEHDPEPPLPLAPPPEPKDS